MLVGSLSPGVLYSRGQLARLLGVERELIRWVPGVLNEMSTRRGTRYEFRRPFLTRMQVARKLHKSRTAVVAVEGTILHPKLGPGDVRLFDVDEVNELIGKPFGVAAHSRWFRQKVELLAETSRREGMTSGTSVNESLRLRRENAQLRRMLTEQLEAWTWVDFSSSQLYVQRRVDEMLSKHLDALDVNVE